MSAFARFKLELVPSVSLESASLGGFIEGSEDYVERQSD